MFYFNWIFGNVFYVVNNFFWKYENVDFVILMIKYFILNIGFLYKILIKEIKKIVLN